MDKTLRNTLLVGGLGIGTLYLLSKNKEPKKSGSEPIKSSSLLHPVSSLVSKKRGGTFAVAVTVKNGDNGISQDYGIGLSIMDISNKVWDLDGNLKLVPAGSATSVYKAYFTAGKSQTMYLSNIVIPNDVAYGDVKIRISIWKEATLPFSTRLADTGWRTPADIRVESEKAYDISITQVNVS